jgi:hypothetical protein
MSHIEIMKFCQNHWSLLYSALSMEVLTLSYLEYLPGGKVDSEGLRILLRGEDDCTRQVLAPAAFPIPLLHRGLQAVNS